MSSIFPGHENAYGKYDHYLKKTDLEPNYLPYVAIADKVEEPEQIIEYVSKRSYENPNARIKFKSLKSCSSLTMILNISLLQLIYIHNHNLC